MEIGGEGPRLSAGLGREATVPTLYTKDQLRKPVPVSPSEPHHLRDQHTSAGRRAGDQTVATQHPPSRTAYRSRPRGSPHRRARAVHTRQHWGSHGSGTQSRPDRKAPGPGLSPRHPGGRRPSLRCPGLEAEQGRSRDAEERMPPASRTPGSLPRASPSPPARRTRSPRPLQPAPGLLQVGGRAGEAASGHHPSSSTHTHTQPGRGRQERREGESGSVRRATLARRSGTRCWWQWW